MNHEQLVSKLANAKKWLLSAAYKLASLSDMALGSAKNLSLTYGHSMRYGAFMFMAHMQVYGRTNRGLFKIFARQGENKTNSYYTGARLLD